MGWSSLRALLPSWRLFDDIAPPLSLWVRSASDRATTLEATWRLLTMPNMRARWPLLLNPEGNLMLFAHSTLERLLSELDDADPSRSVSYRLVQRSVEHQLPGDVHYQFAVRSADEMLLCSAVHVARRGEPQ